MHLSFEWQINEAYDQSFPKSNIKPVPTKWKLVDKKTESPSGDFTRWVKKILKKCKNNIQVGKGLIPC